MREIKVLGVGCATCEKLYKMVIDIVGDTEVKVEKVDDINEIMKYNVMSTPALVIDDKVVHAGGLPKEETLRQFLKDNNSDGKCPCSCGGRC